MTLLVPNSSRNYLINFLKAISAEWLWARETSILEITRLSLRRTLCGVNSISLRSLRRQFLVYSLLCTLRTWCWWMVEPYGMWILILRLSSAKIWEWLTLQRSSLTSLFVECLHMEVLLPQKMLSKTSSKPSGWISHIMGWMRFSGSFERTLT